MLWRLSSSGPCPGQLLLPQDVVPQRVAETPLLGLQLRFEIRETSSSRSSSFDSASCKRSRMLSTICRSKMPSFVGSKSGIADAADLIAGSFELGTRYQIVFRRRYCID